jgi:hypothetical protein
MNPYIKTYLFGAISHGLYLLVLFHWLQVNPSNGLYPDSSSYIEPAQAFIESGQFSPSDGRDYMRTIGYPVFLVPALWLAEKMSLQWLLVIITLQAFFLALVYPAILYLAQKLFALDLSLSVCAVFAIMLSGAFISHTTAILSDGLFALLLICSVACGIAAIDQKAKVWWICHFFFLSWAASTRPILMFYPFASAAYCYYRIKINGSFSFNPVLKKMVGLFLVSLIAVQLPAIRNWINHSVYVSTELSSMALYDYLAKEVLYGKGLGHVYEETAGQIKANAGAEHLAQRINARTTSALDVFISYPVTTTFAMAYNTLLNMVEFHWNNTLFYLFRVNWYKDYADGSVKWSPVPYAAGLIFVMYYGIIYLGAIMYLFIERKPLSFLLALGFFLFPLLAAATNYQGARFRLWCEPFILLAACAAFRHIYECLKKGGENHDRCRE